MELDILDFSESEYGGELVIIQKKIIFLSDVGLF